MQSALRLGVIDYI